MQSVVFRGGLGLIALAMSCLGADAVIADRVTFAEIPGDPRFPEAVEAGALRYACATDVAVLQAAFVQRGHPFEPELLRRESGDRVCHIDYEPTVPGFRIAPDNRPVTGLYATIDPLPFVARRKPDGGSLDVVKEVLSRLTRPIDVTLRPSEGFDAGAWRDAAIFHFAGSPHRFTVEPSGAASTHAWTQDHFKGGRIDGAAAALIPRRLFEGRGGDGEKYLGVLDQYAAPGFFRSKLSWEGGDLLAVADPRDESKTILVHGGVAQRYWSPDLSDGEYGYILRTEFGADSAINLGGGGRHVDYVVGFVPEDGIALVSEPVRKSAALVRAAGLELADLYAERAPRELRRLAAMLDEWDGAWGPWGATVAPQIEQAKSALAKLEPLTDAELETDLMRYSERRCPSDPDSCFSGEGKAGMLHEDPELLRRAADQAADAAAEQMLGQRLLGLIAAQAPGALDEQAGYFDKAAEDLRQAGFRVIRAPLLLPTQETRWAGVGYVNFLLFERRIFVPVLGLGRFEERLLGDLRRRLAGGTKSSLLTRGPG